MSTTTWMRAGCAAAMLVMTSPATASATDSPVPLVPNYRACDFTLEGGVVARGDARPIARITTTAGNVVANVEMLTAEPNTRYEVRIIQVPRPSIGCAPGAPGVALGTLFTDGAGAGSTTVQGPIAAGKTGAWVIVERGADDTQSPAEFYTSEFISRF